MDNVLIDSVVSLWKEGDWRRIVNNFYDNPNHSSLLWVFPTEDNLIWLKEMFVERNIEKVVSVGCGSGLLEWIIKESIGMLVIGIEVDGVWWGSKYAPFSFIPLHLALLDLEADSKTRQILANEQSAMLFCYFNDKDAFKEYLKYFRGKMVIIAGPGKGRGTHAMPSPFDYQLLLPKWKLLAHKEVRQSRDFFAVYVLQDEVN